MYDLLVIGAGLTGLSAALTAAEAGLRVQVVAKGLGVTHWHAGTIDVLGYLPNQATPVTEPLTQLDDLPTQHPYLHLGGVLIADALRWFHALTQELALPYGAAQPATRNTFLPSPVGAPRPTALAPQAQRAGDLQQNSPMVIVGLHGWRDFFPTLIAANLTKSGQPARAAWIPVNTITNRRDFTSVQLAEALDQPAPQARLIAALRKLIQPGERVGVPAILGLHQHTTAWMHIQEQLGAPLFEIPTLPPSVPGLRLFQALQTRLRHLGVRVEVGMEVIGFTASNRQIERVSTATSARPLTHAARNFLLATGGILGGGFNSDYTGRCWEVIFNLPLTVSPERGQWFRHQFLHPDGQPIFSGGISINTALQPINQDGEPLYRNLWAAGSCLAHADPIRERSLEGLAIATGRAAAHAIIKQHA